MACSGLTSEQSGNNTGQDIAGATSGQAGIAGIIDICMPAVGDDGGCSFEGDNQVALTGRVYGCCDASYGSIEPGDLLTSSPTPGLAMKVTDYEQAQGALSARR